MREAVWERMRPNRRPSMPMTPEKIGKYTVIELLGRGGMGEVYLGEDPYIGRRVAIKIIKGADPDARDRFLHEARVIGALAHPAIVSLLDFDFSADEPFLVMELLKGEGLDAWLKKPHSLPEQLVVLTDICQALAYAHENGVLHRDVKPSNVQILASGHAKLMDFGIARATTGKLTATGSVMGTPEYMAPEILKDAVYSPRSDLYACAVLLYEMFTGRNPFAANTVAAALTNVLTLNPPDVRVARPDIPKRLAETLMACLHKEPALRPDGFGALLTAAREAAGGPPGPAIPETRAIPQQPASKAPRTEARASAGSTPPPGKAPWLWIGAVGVVAVMGIVWFLNRTPVPIDSVVASPSAATPATVAPTVTASPTPEAEPEVVATPQPTRTPQTKGRAAAEPADRAPVVAAPTPVATPPPSPPSSSMTLPAISPTPLPQASPLVDSPASTPTPQAPRPPAVAPPTLTSVSPRSFRHGSSTVLEVRGSGLTRDLTASILEGRRPAAGIKVVRLEFVGPDLMRVTILSEPELPLGFYTLVFHGPGGLVTQGLQIEVLL